jgi:Ca-activated chloride channel family protein
LRFRTGTAVLATAAVAVVAVVAGVRFGVVGATASGCTGEVRLTVAVAPELAAAVRGAVDEWVRGKANVDGACVAIDLKADDPADVAAALSARQKVSLTGIGAPRGKATTPGAWIPDSSTWLQRLRSAAPDFGFTDEGPVAQSPVVIGMPEPVAERLGWPDKTLTYADLLREITTSTTTRAGTVDPTRDAAALSGLVALSAAATAADRTRPGTSNGVLRALATDRSALREDLMAQLPQDADVATLASGLGLAAMSERDVITFNAARPPVPLAALYLEPAPAPLDYPFAVMPELSRPQAEAAHRLFAMLESSAAFRQGLATDGLRGPDGSAPGGFAAPTGAPAPAKPASPAAGSGSAAADRVDGAALDRSLASWSAVVAPARMLGIIDASDSMRTPVPTARNATRMAVTLAAAKGGLALFSDDWQVGLWKFAAGREQLVPIEQLTTNRDNVANALDKIQPGGGDTSLYRTILDGYREVQNGWRAGRVNSVVVLTDGVEKVGDLPLGDLLGELRAAKSADRPVQVIVVGIGDAVDRGPLEQITKVTGGGVFIAEDPAQIGAVFLEALSLRTATPR